MSLHAGGLAQVVSRAIWQVSRARVLRSAAVVGLIAGNVSIGLPRSARADDRVVISVDTKAKKGLYPIAVPISVEGDAALAKSIAEIQTFNLGVSSWFRVLDPRSFLADLEAEKMSIEPQRWKDVGAFAVIKSRAMLEGGRLLLDFRLYELEKGAIVVLERSYRLSLIHI